MNNRYVNIKREKTFVASLMKVKFYIQVPANPELVINNIPCRYLGTLKNGEENKFIIGNDGGQLFAIIDTASKDWCNDSIFIPQGEQDIFVSGKPRFNPFKGNPFKFNK